MTNLSLNKLFLSLLFLHTILPSPALAATGPFSDIATVSATVPVIDTTITPPKIITPGNDTYTNNPYEPFTWWAAQTASSLVYIQKYTLYIDDLVYADNINAQSLSQETSVFTVTRTNTYFQLQLKTPLTQGLHHWSIRAHASSNQDSSSENWSFTLDTTLPIIILSQVANLHPNYDSHDLTSIPPYDQRQLIINTANPLFKGKVEANANLKISLLCPSSATGCTDQTITLKDSDGNWEHRFSNLLPNLTYAVYITAVDASGNLTQLPVFTLTYRPAPFIPAVTSYLPSFLKFILPSPLPPTPLIPPAPIPEEHLPPAPPPPTIPTPPPQPITPQLPGLLYSIIVFGLLLHLILCAISAKIPLTLLPRFFLTVFWPFSYLTKSYSTHPWSILTIYHPDNLKRPLTRLVSSITGLFHLPSTLPNLSLYFRLTYPTYLPISLLEFPFRLPQHLDLSTNHQPPLSDRFRLFLFHLRLLPLLIAIITSVYALTQVFNWYLIAYLYLSLHFLFTEYLYPMFSSQN